MSAMYVEFLRHVYFHPARCGATFCFRHMQGDCNILKSSLNLKGATFEVRLPSPSTVTIATCRALLFPGLHLGTCIRGKGYHELPIILNISARFATTTTPIIIFLQDLGRCIDGRTRRGCRGTSNRRGNRWDQEIRGAQSLWDIS